MSETATVMQPKLLQHKQPTFHFLVTSAFTWRTGTDLHALMKEMDKEGYTYYVWFVPVDETTEYDINWYQPQVEGSFVLAKVEAAPKKKGARRG